MADPTEAACLLATGAPYARRLGLRRPDGGLVFAGRKRGALSLYDGDEPIDHFDLDGRWQRSYAGGVHYLKGLDGLVDAIERVREGPNLVLHRRTLSFAEASDLDASIRARALDLLDGLASGRLAPVDPPADAARPLSLDELTELLDRVASWDASAWFAHRERFLATYGPWPFLPPDSQGAVVLQATLGHAGGRAFGGGPAAEFHARSEAEFADHARAVRDLLGRRLVQSRSVFLAGPDALRRPLDEVEARLRIAAETFPIDPGPRGLDVDAPAQLDGIDAFLDDLSPRLPDRRGWGSLRRLGLRRVTLGVESGDAAVRSLYGKSWSDEDLIGLVYELKSVGLAVRLVLLVGAGGVESSAAHAASTAARVANLELGRGDLVYLVDADEVGGPVGADLLRARDLIPLDPPALDAQRSDLRARLAPTRSRRGFKVAPYRMEKQ